MEAKVGVKLKATSGDPFTASLVNVAYSSPDADAKKESEFDDIEAEIITSAVATKNSRFWFKVESPDQFAKNRKRVAKPKTLEHVDDEVRTRLRRLKRDLPPDLKSHIERIREFFLTELAPITLATNGGTLQAQEVIERLLDTKVDSTLVAKFNQMAQRASNVKMALFVLKLFDLPNEYYESLFPPKGIPGGQSNPQDGLLSHLMKMIGDLPTKQDTLRLVREKENRE